MMTDETEKNTTEALHQGMRKGYEAAKARAGLAWWERLLWALLTGIAAAASTMLSACTACYKQAADGSIHAVVNLVRPEGGK